MKPIISILATIAIFANVLTTDAQTANPQPKVGKLTIILDGVADKQGNIMIAVGDLQKGIGSMVGKMVKAEIGTMTIEVDNIPAGEHNIYIFHDENTNYNLDRDEKGMPVEGYGIIQGGNPSKDYETKVVITDQPTTSNISMHYPSK